MKSSDDKEQREKKLGADEGEQEGDGENKIYERGKEGKKRNAIIVDT